MQVRGAVLLPWVHGDSDSRDECGAGYYPTSANGRLKM
jgi:hypothetical protein